MEIKIDKNKLNKNINILEELINKYKENNIDMYNEIIKIDSYFYGEEKDNFISKINDIERNNYIILSSYLDKILTIYKDINEELYRYRKIIYTLEQDYRILTNIYNNLLNNKRVLTKTILINNKIFSLEEYNNILNEISITRENIRITLQNIRI